MNYNDSYIDLINSLSEPYLEVCTSGKILLQNSALSNLIGDSTGKQLFDLVGVADRDRLIKLFTLSTSGGKQQEMRCELSSLEDSRPVPVNISLLLMPQVDPLKGKCLRCRIYPVATRLDSSSGLVHAEQAFKKQARELAILNNLSVAISSSLDLNTILSSICKEMVSIFDARNAGIALLNDTKTALHVVAFYTDHPGESDVTGLEISLKGNDASSFVILTAEPIVVPDAQCNPITKSLHEVMVHRGTSCLLVVPLLTRGDVIGTIGIPSDSQAIFSREDVQLAQTIASQIASVIDNARLHESVQKEKEQAEHELEIGRQIQIGFFPESLPKISGWEVFSFFQSARTVAGDFYDAFLVSQNNKLAIVLADVCDKGLGAALFMVLFRSLLRANLLQSFNENTHSTTSDGDRIIEAVCKTNNYIAANHEKANMFATVFIAVLQQEQDSVWYINCGHDPPLFVGENGANKRLMPTNPAIGIFPDLVLQSKCIHLNKGDSLIAFTDGVSDARSFGGSFFGEKRLLQILSENILLEKRLKWLESSLKEHTEGSDQFDDITCIAFSRS